MTDKYLNESVQFAKKVIIKAGDYIEKSRDKVKIVNISGAQHFCTNIDLEAEQIFIKAIEEEYPTHNIFSEEVGYINKNSEYTWFIDPIDGTNDYLRGIPLYRTSLTLETESKSLLGCSYYPYIKTLYSTTHNGKAYKNNKSIRVNRETLLSNSLIYTYLPSKKIPPTENAKIWKTLQSLEPKIYRFRGDSNMLNCLNWLAQGSIEGIYSLFSSICFHWYDVSSGISMVEQAGGKVTDMFGNPIKNRDLSNGLIASNGYIHDQLLEIIQKSL